MIFQVEITLIAETQIEQAYRWYRQQNSEFADHWFRGLMNAISTLQEKPQRCPLAIEHEIFAEEVRQLLDLLHNWLYGMVLTLEYPLSQYPI